MKAMDNSEPPFSDRLAAKLREKGTPVLVGLDPRWEQLPSALRTPAAPTLEQAATAYRTFCREIIDVVAPLVAAVKPQAAFFEQLGPSGMKALADVIAYARQQKLLVIVDGKRNDIGTTAAAYAEGFLGPRSPWGGDALTVSPYLGDDSLTPFVSACIERNAGVFVLVKTSNSGGKLIQDLVAGGKPIYRHVAEHVESLAANTAAACGYGAVGAVVGATYPQQLAELRSAMPHAWLLVPGYGAQGGAAKDVIAAFDDRGLGAIVNNSRGIIFAYAREPFSSRYGEARWQAAVEAATREMTHELASETPAGKLCAL
jgi:orotidine-5'-phosphate decarboxylase